MPITTAWVKPGCGFQAQVTVTNGSTSRTSSTVGWTFPGDQKINNIWNATSTQSGESVTAKNMSYNGTLAAGAATSFGFTGT
ncbi:MAG TPA: cellulose binding domain-containing protein [Streptosporangiaceae bacterium]|nr:cellulose binding domain-containing protein [Streptosporangiaceae bacterium]